MKPGLFLKALLFEVFFLISIQTIGQFPISPNRFDENGKRTGHWTILYDSTWKKELKNPDSAVYYRLIRFEAGEPVGKVSDFYRTGVKQWEGYLLSLNPSIMDGEVIYYYENGKPNYKCNLIKGVANGLFYLYSDAANGKLVAEGNTKNDLADGVWKHYRDDGSLYTTGKNVNGLKEGIWITYHANGNISSQCDYTQGRKNGMWKFYNEEGIVEETGTYTNDAKTGLWITHFDGGKTLESTGLYDSAGRKTGPWVYYYSNGNKKAEGEIIEGMRTGHWNFYHEEGYLESEGTIWNDSLYHGETKTYYSNGKLESVALYENNEPHGHYIKYHENGQLKEEGEFIRGAASGIWKCYHENGDFSHAQNYINGKINGPVLFYYSGGIIKGETFFVGGALNGSCVDYYPNGVIKRRGFWKENIAEGESSDYYENGQLKLHCFYKDGSFDGLYTSYYPDGIVEKNGRYINNEFEGEWNEYFENGQLASTFFYKSGLYEGPIIQFHRNGKIKHTATSLKGEYQGLAKWFHNNGNLMETCRFKNDERTGKALGYDSLTGKIIAKWYYKAGKKHGKYILYNLEGKESSHIFYVNGFKETPFTIRDSIISLVDVQQYNKAWDAVSWMKRVLKRDYKPTDPAHLEPYYASGYIFKGKGEYTEAIPWYLQYLTLTEKYEGKTTGKYHVALFDLAHIYVMLKRYNEALPIMDSLLISAQKNPERYEYNFQLLQKATVLNNLNKTSEANRLFEEEIKVQEVRGLQHPDVWAIKKMWAEFNYSMVKDYENCIAIYKTLMKDVEAVDPQNELVLHCLQRIAYCNNALDRRTETIYWLKRHLKLTEEKPIPSSEDELSVLLSQLAEKQGQPAMKNTPFTEEYFNDLSLLANNYLNMPYLDSALLVYNKMSEVLTSNNLLNTNYEAILLDGKAEVFLKKFDFKKALELWSTAKGILEKEHLETSERYGDVLIAMGLTYANTNNYGEAEDYYAKGLAIEAELNGEASKSYIQQEIVMAGIYRNMSEYSKSQTLLENVLKKIGDNPEPIQKQNYAHALKRIADIRRDANDYSGAIQYFEKAKAFFDLNKANDLESFTGNLRDLSLMYRKLGLLEKSENYLHQALQAIEEVLGKNNNVYLDMRISLANYYLEQLLFSQAEKIYLEVMNGFATQAEKNNIMYVYAMKGLASLYLDQNEYTKAESQYSQYLNLTKTVTGIHSPDYLHGLENLAKVNFNLQRDDKAEKLYLECEKISRELYGSSHPDYAYYLKATAEFYGDVGRLAQAEEKARLASTLIGAGTYGRKSTIYARYITLLAQIISIRNKNKEAEELLLQAVTITSTNKESFHFDHIDALEVLSDFYLKLGQYNKAEKLMNEVVSLSEKRSGKDYNYAVKRSGLLNIYFALGRYAEVLALGNELLAYYGEELEPSHSRILDLRYLMGQVETRLRNFEAAANHFNFCIEMSALNKSTQSLAYASYLTGLSFCTLVKGDFERTQNLLDRAANIRTGLDKLGIKLSGRTYAAVAGNYTALYQAWGKMEEAEKIWREVNSKLLQYTRDNFYFMNDEEKTQFWKDAKDDFEYFNTFAFLRSKENPAILGDMYNNQLATKAILLSASNKIKNRILGSRDTTMINDYYNWIEAREKLAQLYTLSIPELKVRKNELDSLLMSTNKIEKDLNIAAGDLEHDRGSNQVHWKDVQRVLAPNEAAVEIIRFRYFDRYLRDSVIYAALVLTTETKQNPQLVLLPDGKLLEGRALKFYKNAITAKVEDTFSYNYFWASIDHVVKNKTRIYLSLDGVYNQINLNTLADADGKFLVEKKNITILSNTKDLVPLKSNAHSPVKIMTGSLFGYPKYFIGKERLKEILINKNRDVDFTTLDETDATGIIELPGTQIEIDQVKNILDSNHWQTINYTDEDASEKSLKSIDYPGILHIATHGFFVDEKEVSATFKLGAATEYAKQNPLLRSGLLLSGASNFIQNNFRIDEENGILTAYEAANLNLDNTELVILSACETGKGDVQNGEGVYGLQRAFQTAGASAIIMSLWKVDDQATQELMTSFYQSWMNGSSKAEAFRQAQLQTKVKYNHPYYWGAFVMMGD